MSARMRAARDTTDVDKEKEGREMEACEAEKGPAAAAAAAASPAPTPTPTQDTAPHPGTPTAAQPREEQLSAGYSLPRNSSVISTGSAGDLLHVAPAQEALPRQGSLRGFQRKLSSGRLKESGIDLTQQVTGMTTSASCASFTSTHVLGDVAIKKTEIRKLRDCLGIDEATALRKLQDSVEARRDRNSLADMAVLKETNVHLRKKVWPRRTFVLCRKKHCGDAFPNPIPTQPPHQTPLRWKTSKASFSAKTNTLQSFSTCSSCAPLRLKRRIALSRR